MDLLNKESISNILKAGVGIGTAGIVTKILWNHWHHDSKKKEVPDKWVNVAQVSKLIIYPVKSCQGVEVDSAILTTLGLSGSKYLRDRAFAVVDSKGTFQTQRQFPTLTLVNVQIQGDNVTFSAPGVSSITIQMDELDTNSVNNYRIWQDKIVAIDCGKEIGKWFDAFLNHDGLRLVYDSSTETQRKFTSDGASVKKFPNFSPNDLGVFHDDTAYMVMAQESIDLLNTKLELPVTYKSFRPCVLIDGMRESFSEDFWTFIRFGNSETGPILKNCIPCSRCRITTIDTQNGTYAGSGEPLKTLTTMTRKVGNDTVSKLVRKNAVLGSNFGLFHGAGSEIKIGDPVYAAVV